MVRFAICDDDAAYMKQIVKIIKDTYESMSDFNEPCECILYNSGEELIKNFIEDKIDIFFLDIVAQAIQAFPSKAIEEAWGITVVDNIIQIN